MFFKTDGEIQDIVRSSGYTLEELEHKNSPLSSSISTGAVRFYIEESRPRTYPLAKHLVSWLGEDRGLTLLWITEWGIWPSSENQHLYYRLRESYGDRRILHEAPGHLFPSDETNDLITFVDLTLQFGWGGHIITAKGQPYVFISHDGWIIVDSVSDMRQVIRCIEDFGFPYDYEVPVSTESD